LHGFSLQLIFSLDGPPDGKFAADGHEVQEGIQEGSGEVQEEAQSQEPRIMSGQ
jgi:hypothetical protein